MKTPELGQVPWAHTRKISQESLGYFTVRKDLSTDFSALKSKVHYRPVIKILKHKKEFALE